MKPVFVHIPKTGGASILQICLRLGIPVLDHDLRNPHHVSLAEFKACYPDVFSFAIVRNPWDRVVSTYHYLRSGGVTPGDRIDADRFVNRFPDFRSFVMEGFENSAILDQIHFRPQYLWISDGENIIADRLGRLEKIELHYTIWCKEIGVLPKALPHVNMSTHKPYKEYYDAQTIKRIRQVYARDIALFKYKF